MSRKLNDKRRAAAGRPDSALVFLHGYGADAADLIGLAEVLAPHLPATVFHAPDAPDSCAGTPFGFQWFPIPSMDGSDPAAMGRAFDAARADLHAYLDGVLADEGLAPDRLALLGFSQGTMMALHVAAERRQALAGVVGFSGRIVDPALLASPASRPPVLLLHGDQDPVVPFAQMEVAKRVLTDGGFTVHGHVMQGTAHGIAPDGLSAALAFLKDCLASSA